MGCKEREPRVPSRSSIPPDPAPLAPLWPAGSESQGPAERERGKQAEEVWDAGGGGNGSGRQAMRKWEKEADKKEPARLAAPDHRARPGSAAVSPPAWRLQPG